MTLADGLLVVPAAGIEMELYALMCNQQNSYSPDFLQVDDRVAFSVAKVQTKIFSVVLTENKSVFVLLTPNEAEILCILSFILPVF